MTDCDSLSVRRGHWCTRWTRLVPAPPLLVCWTRKVDDRDIPQRLYRVWPDRCNWNHEWVTLLMCLTRWSISCWTSDTLEKPWEHRFFIIKKIIVKFYVTAVWMCNFPYADFWLLMAIVFKYFSSMAVDVSRIIYVEHDNSCWNLTLMLVLDLYICDSCLKNFLPADCGFIGKRGKLSLIHDALKTCRIKCNM